MHLRTAEGTLEQSEKKNLKEKEIFGPEAVRLVWFLRKQWLTAVPLKVDAMAVGKS